MVSLALAYAFPCLGVNKIAFLCSSFSALCFVDGLTCVSRAFMEALYIYIPICHRWNDAVSEAYRNIQQMRIELAVGRVLIHVLPATPQTGENVLNKKNSQRTTWIILSWQLGYLYAWMQNLNVFLKCYLYCFPYIFNFYDWSANRRIFHSLLLFHIAEAIRLERIVLNFV